MQSFCDISGKVCLDSEIQLFENGKQRNNSTLNHSRNAKTTTSDIPNLF